jgi:hypothetical protein
MNAVTNSSNSKRETSMSIFQNGRARRRAAIVSVVMLTACGTSNSKPISGSPTTDGMAGMNHGSDPAPTTVATIKGVATTEADPMAGMDHSGGAMAMDPVAGDGTKDSAAGYTMRPTKLPTAIGTQQFSFTVTGPDGAPIKDAVVEQTKKLHLIVVRSDLTGYQHLHPELASDGTWSVPVEFAAGGRWHIIADLTPVLGTRVVLGLDATIAGDSAERPLPAPAQTTMVDGFDVVLDGQLSTTEAPLNFAIRKGGAPASTITEYLGAGGHLVALRSDTLAYTHLHPNGDAGPVLSFAADVPTTGTYRLFLQFATGDQVHTAEFTAAAAS